MLISFYTFILCHGKINSNCNIKVSLIYLTKFILNGMYSLGSLFFLYRSRPFQNICRELGATVVDKVTTSVTHVVFQVKSPQLIFEL